MSKMKKILATLLAVAMMASVGSTVFAGDVETGCAITGVLRSREDVNDIVNIEKNKISPIETESELDENRSSSKTESEFDANSTSSEAMNLIDKLPPEQQNAELDSALAAMRKANKEGNIKFPDGTLGMMTRDYSGLPGQSKNIPSLQNEPYAITLQRAVVILDYLEKELKLPKPEVGYVTGRCMDPRINAIYDDDDKGVAQGYENSNIYIEEYETDKEDVYNYLFLVRESAESDWKIIHQGDSYKLDE